MGQIGGKGNKGTYKLLMKLNCSFILTYTHIVCIYAYMIYIYVYIYIVYPLRTSKLDRRARSYMKMVNISLVMHGMCVKNLTYKK